MMQALVKISDIRIGNRKRPISPEKVSGLAASIKTVGLINPITISSDNDLITGLHRLEAKKSLGHDVIDAIVKDCDDLSKELVELDENLIRNDLTDIESGELLLRRDEIFALLGQRAKVGDNKHSMKSGENISPLKTTKKLAQEAGISERTAQHRKQVAKNIREDVKEKIKKTPLASNITALLEISRLPEELQSKVVESIGGHPKRNIKKAVRKMVREERIKEAHQKGKDFVQTESIKLLLGDFTQVCETIDDNSVDMIMTDPPYLVESQPLWKDLAGVAQRKLKPNGYLITHVGQMYFDKVIEFFKEAGLEYFWTAVIKLNGNHPRVWARHVYCNVRFLLIFAKPPVQRLPECFSDFFESTVAEKDYHPWQQSVEPCRYLIEKFTKPNDLVLDPFICTGTTAIAALMEGRRCIGIDIEQKNLDVAKGRIQEFMKDRETKK